MSYLGYVIAAYAVFLVVLGGEFLASWLQVRKELGIARRRAARHADSVEQGDGQDGVGHVEPARQPQPGRP